MELKCNDCGKILFSGDSYMPYKNTSLIKCEECHQKDPVLREYQNCEVYSRVVGYIRPVKQWNPGKKREFEDRVEFKTDLSLAHSLNPQN